MDGGIMSAPKNFNLISYALQYLNSKFQEITAENFEDQIRMDIPFPGGFYSDFSFYSLGYKNDRPSDQEIELTIKSLLNVLVDESGFKNSNNYGLSRIKDTDEWSADYWIPKANNPHLDGAETAVQKFQHGLKNIIKGDWKAFAEKVNAAADARLEVCRTIKQTGEDFVALFVQPNNDYPPP